MATSRIQDALASVPEEYYTHREDGSLVRQSSSAEAITAGLERLDVRPGMRVLEIGTGSGFSGALLGALVGEGGSVVSVDVVDDLVVRARDLHARRGADNIRVVTRDGTEGAPDHAPYDRIVAWASSDLLHRAWADQCVPGAALVVPVAIAPLPRANAIVRAHRTRDGRLAAERLWPGGYVEMHPEELTQWLVPPRGVHAQTADQEGNPWWVSGMWISGEDTAARARSLVDALAVGARTEGGALLGPEEPVADFHAYLYATAPEGLSMFGLGARGWAPGHASAGGAAAMLGGGRLLSTGDTTSGREVRRWVHQWRQADRPSAGTLSPVLEETGDGWLVRARVRTRR
ncbi:protein-L-isoaspartate O-methyltransferase family protein [Nocardiopsis lucentensis]|uniref:protein-L-isoaspartate O-methyltransferase family protein n=1 Tax=Nocardiopsis lucentensis TaxID=53441 RepID=UPI00034DE5CB|nr:methyltransferase domain-containing protein [Nocardiopsis lucentensis]